MNSLFKSGWWVGVAALVVVGLVMALLIRPGPSRLRGDGSDPSTYGFDLSCADLGDGPILAGGMPRDGLRAVNEVLTAPGAEVATINREKRGKFLVPTDRVVGVSFDGRARAYPLRLLRWHEVVNDSLGESVFAVTYSGLCDSVAVWDRKIDGEVLTFGVSGLVRDSNTLLYDRSEEEGPSSLWSQLSGVAAAGPASCAGSALQLLPCEVVRWEDWFRNHPETEVMMPLPGFKRLYKRDPYHSYFGSEILHFPVKPMPRGSSPALKDRVVILDVAQERAVLSLTDLAVAAGETGEPTTIEVGGLSFRLHVPDSADAVRAEAEGPGAEPPGLRMAFWFAWHAQIPGSIPVAP